MFGHQRVLRVGVNPFWHIAVFLLVLAKFFWGITDLEDPPPAWLRPIKKEQWDPPLPKARPKCAQQRKQCQFCFDRSKISATWSREQGNVAVVDSVGGAADSFGRSLAPWGSPKPSPPQGLHLLKAQRWLNNSLAEQVLRLLSKVGTYKVFA